MPNPSSRPALPSPRDLLTSIFNSLPQTALPAESGLPTNANSNPLKALSATHRSLLVTLHVLFPSLLLQALDLLDRGLVTRVVQVTPSTTSDLQAPTVWPPQAHIHLPITGQAESGSGEDVAREQRQNESLRGNENTVYVVRSARSTHSRSGSSSSRYSAAQGNSYIVRLNAWNCSCAAFAFSAFPASTSGPFSPRFEDDASAVSTTAASSGARDARRTDSDWEFGGLSSDGTAGHGDGVPCCKHLMACLLAERWQGVLGGYVKQMRVGREEMAGLGADGGV